jgi:hypothetical protein
MPRKRRSSADVAKLIQRVKALVDGGMSKMDAYDKVGLAGSVYQRHERALKRGNGKERGSINIAALPPRPKKYGKRQFNPNNVTAVARRIQRIDEQLAKIGSLNTEREGLAARLKNILKI